jgi:hypothetical protein
MERNMRKTVMLPFIAALAMGPAPASADSAADAHQQPVDAGEQSGSAVLCRQAGMDSGLQGEDLETYVEGCVNDLETDQSYPAGDRG